MILYQNTDFSEDSILIQFFETQKKKIFSVNVYLYACA